jgi:hypothetical protein
LQRQSGKLGDFSYFQKCIRTNGRRALARGDISPAHISQRFTYYQCNSSFIGLLTLKATSGEERWLGRRGGWGGEVAGEERWLGRRGGWGGEVAQWGGEVAQW